ncbi:MAG: hypothetical protein KAU06_00355 [Candidatus Marinimicrobia bacterium]|nr:hypothetical protein [Candidatus Neomarinimicrobiota bacterium]
MLHRIFIILSLFIGVCISFADEPDSNSYRYINIVEQLQDESSLIISPVEEWGLQGNLSNYGLPGYGISITYNGFPLGDPLYGMIPFSWMNNRLQKVNISSSLNSISLTPVFADSGMNLSRFDYYRGDYGFLNFGLMVSGNISENISWRFTGENLAYDGGYGLFGPDIFKLRESITQNYFLDVRKYTDTWLIDLGTSYQKFTPGLSNKTILGTTNNETYLNWTHAGRLKEYRTNFYVTGTRSDSSGLVKAGVQMTNYLYHVSHDSSLYKFTAEGYQLSGVFKKEIHRSSSKLTLSATPIAENIYLRHGAHKNRILFKQHIDYTRQRNRMNYSITIGSVNLNPTAGISGTLPLSDRFNIGILSKLDYTAYPLSFYTDIGGLSSNKPENDGFSSFQQSLNLRYDHGASYLNSQINHTYAHLIIPHKNAITDTSFTFNKKTINSAYLTEELRLQFPWKMHIKGRAILSPSTEDGSPVSVQGWSRLYQEIFLFHRNLHLYLTGDIFYQTSPNSVIWFEQLRTNATSNQSYYTNERLTASATIGAYISDFHIFYTIYNAEGRIFSSFPGMPTRNRLKIFGVDWTFIN